MEAPNNTRFIIEAAKFEEAVVKASEFEREQLTWFFNYARHHNYSLTEMGSMVKQRNGNSYRPDSLRKFFTDPASNWEWIANAIQIFRKGLDRGTAPRLGFVATPFADKVFEGCTLTMRYRRIGYMWGASQNGKTFAAEEYAKTNSADVIYYRIPGAVKPAEFHRDFAERALGICDLRGYGLKQATRQKLSAAKLVILDEFNQIFALQKRECLSLIEILRDYFDICQIGVLFLGSLEGRDEFVKNKGRYAEFLGQLYRRRIFDKTLPPAATSKDLNVIAKGLDLSPATGEALDVQTEVINEFGLGYWCTILQAATVRASKKQRGVTWDDVVFSYDTIKDYEDEDNGKESK